MASPISRVTLSLKLTLFSAGAVLLSLSLPHLFTFPAPNDVVASLRMWLQPPYIYLVINSIILFIAASSRLHFSAPSFSNRIAPNGVVSFKEFDFELSSAGESEPYIYADVEPDKKLDVSYGVVSMKVEFPVSDESEPQGSPGVVSTEDAVEVVEGAEEPKDDDVDYEVPVGSGADVTSNLSRPQLVRQEAIENLLPVTTRFGRHRRPAKATSEGGKTLRVSKQKRHETLESTWKAITERRHMPLSRHLKIKSETSNVSNNLLNHHPQTVKKYGMSKELDKLKKEPSMSQDELNRRVEAFIRKFNDEMRLQRQQSEQQFMEMINRAA